MNLGTWLEKWLILYVDPSGLAPNTKACYHRAVEAVPDTLASHDLSDLSPIDLMEWLVFVSQKHPRAAQLDRVMLSKALRTARKAGLCPALVITRIPSRSRHTPQNGPLCYPWTRYRGI